MDNFISNPNEQVIFHPVNDAQRDIEEAKKFFNNRQKVAEHVNIHYRKYLFGSWALCGFAIALTTRLFFGTSTTSSTTSAAYESPTLELNAIVTFNQMDAIAQAKDNYFHGTGKIYTFSGESLFKRYDTLFHALDNAYHRAIPINEKIKRAQKLEQFFKIQNELFASTEYTNPEQDTKFAQLDNEFMQTLMEVKGPLTGNNQTVTGTNQI